MSAGLIKELLYNWRYEPMRGYAFTEFHTVAANFTHARGEWWELDLRAAYVWLFTESLPVHKADVHGGDVRLTLFRDAPMRLEPIGRLYHSHRQYNYYRYLEDRYKWRDGVYYCFNADALFPRAPRPPFTFVWQGVRVSKDVWVVEEENLEDFILVHKTYKFGCISERDMFKYGALIAIGKAGQGQAWHLSATRGLSHALVQDVLFGGGALSREVHHQVRAPTAVLVDSILSLSTGPPAKPDALEYKFFRCIGEKTSVLGLIGRRCECNKWTDYRIWILEEDMALFGWRRFWCAMRELVDAGKWADAPQFRLVKSLATRGVSSARLVQIHKLVPKNMCAMLKNVEAHAR